MNLNPGKLKRIHVNAGIIRADRHKKRRRPPISIKVTGLNIKAHEVKVNGPCKLIYSPNKPLHCGARLWIETRAGVITH